MTSAKLPIRVRRARVDDADLPFPNYETSGSAGMDLRAAVTSPLTLEPGERILVPTGLMLEIPVGFEGQVRPRSGLALRHGVTVLNSPGTLDSDFRGEVQVLLINHGSEPFEIARGERIAQLVFASLVQVEWVESTSLGETTRGAGGFGHTGR